MRPGSIIWFERLWLAGLVLGFANTLLNYGTLREFAIANDSSPGAILVGAGFGLLFNVLFWYLIARKASNAAKWVLVGFTALGLVVMAIEVEGYLAFGTIYMIGFAALTALQLVALSYLFRDDSVLWLTSKGREGVFDPAVFD